MVGILVILIVVGRVEISGVVYEGGKVDSAWKFSSKNVNQFQKLPPVFCILFT